MSQNSGLAENQKAWVSFKNPCFGWMGCAPRICVLGDHKYQEKEGKNPANGSLSFRVRDYNDARANSVSQRETTGNTFGNKAVLA